MGLRLSIESFRLAGRSQDRAPGKTVRVQVFLPGAQEFNRHVDELVMQISDHQASLAGHSGVGGMTREEIAEDGVLGIGRAAADEVARIKIAHDQRDLFRLEIRLDALTQKQADVLELAVARGVVLGIAGGQQVLSRPLRPPRLARAPG